MIKLLFISPLPGFLMGKEWLLPEIRTTTSDRIALWLHALDIATFFGNGGDYFVCHSELSPKRPHNSMLLILVNWGVIPLACYVLLIIKLLIKTVNCKNSKTISIGSTLLGGIAYSFISGVLDSPLSQILACITLAMFWISIKNTSNNINSTSSHYFIIITCIIIVTLVSHKVSIRIANDFYQDEKYIPEVYAPQFWLGNNCTAVPFLKSG
ncbi:hypothetical protein VIRA109638_16070 [Vibrio rarus]